MPAKTLEFAADLLDPDWRNRFGSAKDFLAQAGSDPVVRLRIERREFERRRRIAAAVNDEKQILADLWAAGIQVASIATFVNGPTPPSAIPILLRHLGHEHLPETIESLARALSDRPRQIKGLFTVLLRQVKRQAAADSQEARRALWFLGRVLGRSAVKGNADDLLEIVRRPHFGAARAGAVEGLARIGAGDWRAAARALLDDNDATVVKAALKALARESRRRQSG